MNTTTTVTRFSNEPTPGVDLAGKVTKGRFLAYGGFSDNYKGSLKHPNGQQIPVAIKILRLDPKEPEADLVNHRLNKEAKVWHNLDHKNILQFFGFTRDFPPSPALISPFCEEGNVMTYIKNNQNTDRSLLILQVARGLEYLHSRSIIHGDLKCPNVLISEGRPLLCDFGHSKIIGMRGFTTGTKGTRRYMAPELLGSECSDLDNFDPVLTLECDIYGLGMVGLEILTENVPFHLITNDTALESRVKKGIPSDLKYLPAYESTWKVVQRCWALKSTARPSISSVIRDLQSR